jgi:hypothetical protein
LTVKPGSMLKTVDYSISKELASTSSSSEGEAAAAAAEPEALALFQLGVKNDAGQGGGD